MPELPEVEVLVRHLQPVIAGKRIRAVQVNRSKILLPTSLPAFKRALQGATFRNLTRRGKYLVFELSYASSRKNLIVLGHLGMTGKMFVQKKQASVPKHAAVVLDLGGECFVFEDTRYFGRMTLDTAALANLGPEPLGKDFTPAYFAEKLQKSRQPIKVKLLDQSLVAGIGNIYASEALFLAGISPARPAYLLTKVEQRDLIHAIRKILAAAIRLGSTVPLNFGPDKSDALFYFGRHPEAVDYYEERLRVYDRAGKPCINCGSAIKRVVQGARSTFFCPACQKS
jgi:formamidopyrimidine-DNA glycosylase